MATVVWRDEDIFSDSYLDAFYRAHIAPRRGNLDDDIAAIEAEIRKVQKYQSRFRGYKCDTTLNSCGSSECSDDQASGDESDFSMVGGGQVPFPDSYSRSLSYVLTDYSPTSVFKVYNSSSAKGNDITAPRGADIFTWAVLQQITHDHNYCSPEHLEEQTPLDHGTVHVKNVQWHLLTPPKRAQAVHKLSCILRHQPPYRLPPSLSSLDLLPHSIASAIRKTGSLGIYSYKDGSGGRMRAKPTVMVTCQKIDVKEIQTLKRAHDNQYPSTLARGHIGPMARGNIKKKTRYTPYDRMARLYRQQKAEVSRIRNSSSCSEDGEDPIVID